jgi:hypothetical protein
VRIPGSKSASQLVFAFTQESDGTITTVDSEFCAGHEFGGVTCQKDDSTLAISSWDEWMIEQE